ncbi:MAG TPA: LytTR family DNA-binding domain-containing protein [Pyrinomonadaceae bacterium]|nr:LytTR family DNA-binding domain-containing protein [Pyrinomonadaceae bacterium]
MKIRTLIVDDVALARRRIRRHLGADPDFEVVGECSDGREAVEAVRNLKPDLVFLDVQMPEMDGFRALEELGGEAPPAVIFVTAHDQFALRAFEVHALDYLLKPFDPERLAAAAARAKAQLAGARGTGVSERLRALLQDIRQPQPKFLKRLAVKAGGRVIFLTADEIDWIETAGNYLKIHAGKASHLIRERMSQMEARLDPERFARIHRTTLVNIDRIKEMHPLFNGDQLVRLSDGRELTMSRTYRDRLMSLLERR